MIIGYALFIYATKFLCPHKNLFLRNIIMSIQKKKTKVTLKNNIYFVA